MFCCNQSCTARSTRSDDLSFYRQLSNWLRDPGTNETDVEAVLKQMVSP